MRGRHQWGPKGGIDLTNKFAHVPSESYIFTSMVLKLGNYMAYFIYFL